MKITFGLYIPNSYTFRISFKDKTILIGNGENEKEHKLNVICI